MVFMSGTAVLAAGIGSKLTVIGAAGFPLMLTGGYWLVSSRSRRRKSKPKP